MGSLTSNGFCSWIELMGGKRHNQKVNTLRVDQDLATCPPTSIFRAGYLLAIAIGNTGRILGELAHADRALQPGSNLQKLVWINA
jgi:hypothetical protein